MVSRQNKQPRVVRLDQLHLPRPSQSPFCSSANFAIRLHSYIYLMFRRQEHLPSGVHQRPDQSKLVHEIDSKRHSREAECAGGSDLNTPLEQPVADQHTEAVVSDPHQRQWCPWVLAKGDEESASAGQQQDPKHPRHPVSFACDPSKMCRRHMEYRQAVQSAYQQAVWRYLQVKRLQSATRTPQ